ncbi:MAG: beta-propeller fold lactonase family protein [Acidobacteriota bacterium]|nr:MAG: beta-propeller fold lactonase family protein [Acidobacteriota bacterium]
MIRNLCLILLLIPAYAACTTPEAVQPERLLVVLNKSDHTATVLDRDTGGKLATIVTGLAPHEVAVDPERGIGVVANYGTSVNPGSSLSVLDLRSRRAIKTIGLKRFRRPHGIQFFRDGSRVAVTAEANQAVLIVNVETSEIEQVVPTGQQISHMLVLSPDEKWCYVTNIESGSLSVLNLERSQLYRTLDVGEGAEGIDVSPDGKELWIASRAEDRVAVIDTETLEITEHIETGSFPIRVRFLSDGEHVLVSNARTGDVSVLSRSEKKEIQRVSMGLTAKEQEDRLLQFDLSPVPIGIVLDDELPRAYIANSNADIITVLDLVSWEITARLQAGEEPDGMGVVTLHPPVPEETQSAGNSPEQSEEEPVK